MSLIGLAMLGSAWAADVTGSVSILYYVLPRHTGYMGAVARADLGAAHLEARYNYEEVRTGSVFLGGRAVFGEKFNVNLLVLVGAMFGKLAGAAPGWQLTFSWRGLYLYDETEFCLDFTGRGNGYSFTWNELVAKVAKPLRIGLVVQRSFVAGVETEWAFGALVRITDGTIGATVHILNLGPQSPGLLLSVRARY